MVWKVDNISVVFFSPPGRTSDDALQLWTALGVGSPDSFQRPQGTLAGASSLATGVTGKVRTAINAQLGRVDINWTGANSVRDEPPFLDDWKAVEKEAQKATKKLLDSIDSIRIGVAVNVSRRLNNEDIIAELGKLNLNASFPEGSEDIIYQFNSPRNFLETGARMNRLHTWTTGRQQMISFNINIGQPTAGPVVVRAIPVITFRIDVNSINLSIDQLKNAGAEIVDELFTEARNAIIMYCEGV